jgi:membrane protein implicated in regulation of membrane protease activity
MGEAFLWIVLAVVFVVLEFGHRQLMAFFIAVGAILAAIVGLAGLGSVVQIPVFFAGAVSGLFLLRPMIMRSGGFRGYGLVSGIKAHVGEETVLVEAIGGAHEPGRVKLHGELWKAVASDGGSIPAGTLVMMIDMQGTTFIVQDISNLGLGTGALPEI